MKKASFVLVVIILSIVLCLALASCGNSNGGGGNHTVSDDLTGNELKLEGFKKIDSEVIGTMYYIEIPSAKMVFSLSDLVTVPDGSSWTISTDISGNKTIASKTLQLDYGDNLYYLQVHKKDSRIDQYVLLIHRNYMYTVTYKSNGSTLSTESVEEGKYASPPTITAPTGYTFGGWEGSYNEPVKSNITVTAKWIPKEYKITYDANGGSVSTKTQTVKYGAYFSTPTPTRDGYTFEGWYFNSKKYSSGYYNYDYNLNLTAEWSAKKYKITYNLGGGTNNPDNSTYYYAYEPIVLCSPSLEGYEFLGWTYDGISTPQINLEIDGTFGDRTFTANWEYDCANGVELTLIGNEYEVSGIGNSSGEHVIIPSKYKGKSVTSIGASAFSLCDEIKSITIPDSITKIGVEAFQYCTNLTDIFIPNSVTSIASYAFYGCRNLTSVTISEGITSIASYAFYGCSNLTSVTIPESVTSIGYSAFYGCRNLTSVTISEGITSIASYAFYGCRNLTSVTIPKSVTSIGYSAFYDLKTINYRGSKSQWLAISKEEPIIVLFGGSCTIVYDYTGY